MVISPALAIIVSLLLAALVLYWRRCRYWSNRLKGSLSTGISFPIIGDLHYFLGHYLGGEPGILFRAVRLAKSMNVFKDLAPAGVWAGERPHVIIFKAEDLEVLLGSSRTNSKPGFMYNPVKAFFGSGLITLNGETWTHHRKVLSPVFHFKILEKYVDVFKKCAEDLSKELLEPKYRGVEVNALPITIRLVLNTICETAFGMSNRLSAEDEIKERETFMEALDVAFKIIVKHILQPWLRINALFRLTPSYGKIKTAQETINRYASRIIRMKKEEIKSDSKNGFTDSNLEDDTGAKKKVAFLDLVLRDKTNLLSEDEVLQEVRTLVTVQQTTATTLSFIFVMLAIHQDVQEQVFREIQELDTDRPFFEQLGEMKYLERVIKETLRLYPTTTLFSRVSKEDLTLSNCTLPAGCDCSVFLYFTHRDKRFYGPDPERFNPDHFLPERCQARHPYAYVPFSAGPRNCIGQKYAMLQMKTVVSTLVRNFRILPGKGCHSQEELKIDMDTFLFIVGGFNVRFEPRVA